MLRLKSHSNVIPSILMDCTNASQTIHERYKDISSGSSISLIARSVDISFEAIIPFDYVGRTGCVNYGHAENQEGKSQ
ncbi:hypothetical protein TNCV_2601781 [Trichonephila clavipes]|nr:hypothetical protein TNCV_2601781 [Trichonephila clavipes]